MKKEIDIVITWVDGSDSKWVEQYNKYASQTKGDIDLREERYRDWDNLQYWFRGIEKFMPWVRKIHFVTWGHLPKWMDKTNPKLNIVHHKDILEEKYLPVFNVRPLEINFHKIEGLSEQFIFFNDDMYVINQIKPEYFFRKGLPKDIAILNIVEGEERGHLELNNLNAINRNFNKFKVMFKHLFKWINLKYGIDLIRTVCLLIWPKFTGFLRPHQPQPYLKETFVDIWNKEREVLEKTQSIKFRDKYETVSQYLFRDWQLVKGNFFPMRLNKFKFLSIKTDNYRQISKIIKKQKYSIVCLNDSTDVNSSNFEDIKNIINKGFDKVLSNKSKFEI